MAFNFGEAKPAELDEHGKWGIGNMHVHVYVSPAISVEHQKVVQEAVHEFFNLFPDRKNWFEISSMPWQKVENIMNNSPKEYRDIIDLSFSYYIPELDKIYKNNTTPLTTITVIPHNYTSGNNGAGTDFFNHVIVFDLLYPEHLKSVIKHELGHRFGCHHCEDDPSCIMNQSGVGAHFCQKHLKEMKMRIAMLYANSRPIGQKEVKKHSFNFGQRDVDIKSSR